MQKKSYRILEEMLQGNSESCKRQIAARFDQIKELLIDSLSSAVPSSKAVRINSNFKNILIYVGITLKI